MAQHMSELKQKKTMEMKVLDLECNVKVLSLEKESLETKTRGLKEDIKEQTQYAKSTMFFYLEVSHKVLEWGRLCEPQ